MECRVDWLSAMGTRCGTGLLAAASLLGLFAGGAWLVVLACGEKGDRELTLLASGDSLMIEYDAVAQHELTHDDRVTIANIAAGAVADVHRALPMMPTAVELHVSGAQRATIIPETGENGSNAPPNLIFWSVDTNRPEGVAAIARRELRATLFHELHHLVRSEVVVDGDIVSIAIGEGLATAFERDFAGAQPPWGQYPSDVDAWARELLTLPPELPRDEWLYRRRDGRRWFGMRVGTYLVDRAMTASAKTSADLVQTPTEMILAAAIGSDAGMTEQ